MIEYSTIEHALDELRAGHLIMCTDDPERENEGDLICAAQFATTENINFMATHAKGLICMPMNDEYIAKLALPQMVARNTDNHETAFTVSIDHVDTTTGISAAERSITAMKCVDPDAQPQDFRRPGHMQEYRKTHDHLVEPVAAAKMPTAYGTFVAHGFRNTLNGEHHVALVKGNIGDGETCSCACIRNASRAMRSARCDATAASSSPRACARSNKRDVALFCTCARRAAALAF